MAFKKQFVAIAVTIAVSNNVIAQSSNTPVNSNGPATVPSINILTTPAQYPTGIPTNYIRSWVPSKPLTTEADVISSSRTVEEVKKSTVYLDGLGRNMQTVSWQMSNSKKDIVAPIIYDELGRESVKYLPYAQTISGTNTNDGLFKNNPFNNLTTFYSSVSHHNNHGINGEQVFYAQTIFESSPLNRPIKSLAPGNSWAGSNRGTTISYEVNEANEVRLWSIGATAGSNPSTSSYYSPGSLARTVTKDEHDKMVVEYKDKEGKTILKKVQLTSTTITSHSGWLCTYYIYDNLGLLRFVVQPKATEWLASSGVNWNFAATNGSTVTAELCFRYEYDAKKRIQIKKVPGAGEVHLVYDQFDRLIMTQDAKMRQSNKWLITQYDGLNRPTKTVLWNNSSNRAYHQGQADIASGNYPTLSGTYEILTETYYDNYDWVAALNIAGITANLDNTFTSSSDYISPNTAPLYAQTIVQASTVNGMVTGTKVKVLGTNTYLYTVSFFDYNGQQIQVRSTNLDGGYDIMTTQYSFTGQVLKNHHFHKRLSTSSSLEIITTNEYKHTGSVSTIKKKIKENGNTKVDNLLFVEHFYNEMGQLKRKDVGNAKNIYGEHTNEPIEKLDYTYNIRGWLNGINRGLAKSQAYTTEGPEQADRWFGMELAYDFGFNDLQYNGNIAGTVWKTKGSQVQRAYGFAYDAANRLLSADFNQYTSNGWNLEAGIDFSMKMGDGINASTAYDANGNIQAMMQMGVKAGESLQIDDLVYHYSTLSNKLQGITEATAGSTDHKLGDFVDRNESDADYAYDNNGNLVHDNNKFITSINYNYLNLPDEIAMTYADNSEKGTIAYIYDATGNKLRKKVYEQPSNVFNNDTEKETITTYIGGIIYESSWINEPINGYVQHPDKLLFFSHEEGRCRQEVAEEGNTWHFDYFVKDHLGNIRLVLTDEQQQDIYPAATLEQEDVNGNNATQIERNYYAIDDNYIVHNNAASGIDNYPYENNNGNPPPNNNPHSNVTNTSEYLFRINGNQNKTGLGKAIKVMAGDRVDVFGKSYYVDYNYSSNNTLTPLDILTGLLSAPGSAISGKHGILDPGNLNNNSIIAELLNGFISNQEAPPTSNAPRAYINWVLFDENFKFVSGNISPVGDNGELKDHYTDPELQNIEITTNGYFYMYCSNESPVDVFFDNVQLIHTRGALLEETHYYPFGLTMSGISSKAAGKPKQSLKYNGKEEQREEFSDGAGLEMSDFGARFYDLQIGRWHVIDPMADNYTPLSPYNYVANSPLSLTDKNGADWFIDDNLNIIWDNSTNSNICVGDVSYKNIGRSVTITTVSFINKPNDLPLQIPFNEAAAGNKLTTSITLTGYYNEDGSFKEMTYFYDRAIGSTFNLGDLTQGTETVPGKTNSKEGYGLFNNHLQIETHSTTPAMETIFLQTIGRNVDVNQILDISLINNKLGVQIQHGSYPSVKMDIRAKDTNVNYYNYQQASFIFSHAPKAVTDFAVSSLLRATGVDIANLTLRAIQALKLHTAMNDNYQSTNKATFKGNYND